jgi:hypothetical protein
METMMNKRIFGAALGALLLGGSALANASGLRDLFNLLPHPEQRFEERHEHDARYLDWHRDARGLDRHDTFHRDRDDLRREHRFDAHRDYDRDDHPRFAWHGHDHDRR